MSKLSKIVSLIVIVVIIGAIGFLASWDIPAPSEPVVKIIPNERFLP